MSDSPGRFRRPRILRGRFRGLVLVLAVGAAFVVPVAPASAHAQLLSSDPAESSQLAEAPSSMELVFSEPVALNDVQAFAGDGEEWQVEAEVTDNTVKITPQSDPGTGTVVVSWDVRSQDGHNVDGALTFSIGTPTAGAAGGKASAATHTSSLVMQYAVTATAAIVALVLVGAAVVRRRPPDWSWLVGFAAAVLVFPSTELVQNGRDLSGLIDWSLWLESLLQPAPVCLFAAVVLAGLWRHGNQPRGAAVAAAGVVVLLGGVAAATWPAPPEASKPVAAAPASAETTLADFGTVEVTATPEQGQQYIIDLVLRDPQKVPLTVIETPTLRLANDEVSLGEVALKQQAAGAYRGAVTAPVAGTWTAQVSVRITRFDNPVAEVDIGLAPPSQ